jgi:hypothetical protein
LCSDRVDKRQIGTRRDRIGVGTFSARTREHEADILIGAGATIERTVALTLAGIAESVVVEGAGSRIEARHPGFGNRFGPEDIKAIPA